METYVLGIALATAVAGFGALSATLGDKHFCRCGHTLSQHEPCGSLGEALRCRAPRCSCAEYESRD